MKPLELVPLETFDEKRHSIDSTALEYLQKASTKMQNLIPIKTFGDGNCLFNSVVAVMPDGAISVAELRGM
jgi:hypothetical protein